MTRALFQSSGWLELLMVVMAGAGTLACDRAPESKASAAPQAIHHKQPGAPEAHVGGDQHVMYVPAYSHLLAGADRRIMLTITLSVRNVDPRHEVSLQYVDYYDTPGHLVRRYLSREEKLGPLGTKEYSVELFDDAGGSGANFLIGWRASDEVHPLLAEAVMLGQTTNGSIAFASRGIALRSTEKEASAAPATEGEPVLR